jgi:hypothetical protein
MRPFPGIEARDMGAQEVAGIDMGIDMGIDL